MPASDTPPLEADVVGILGSPRRGGNTETLLDSALAGAAEAGHSTAKIVLNDLSIRPCQNCGFCGKNGRCWIEDDMQTLYPILDVAPRIIVAAPIFFTNVSAQTKLMVDRCQTYWARRYVLKTMPDVEGRRGAFISVGGFKKAMKFFECAERLVKSWCITLGIRYVGGRFYEHIDAKGDAAKHPTARDECYALGKEL